MLTPAIKAGKTPKDELARYLATPTEATDDPLRWWTERRTLYPCLSRMALDYLSIPGTSLPELSSSFLRVDPHVDFLPQGHLSTLNGCSATDVGP